MIRCAVAWINILNNSPSQNLYLKFRQTGIDIYNQTGEFCSIILRDFQLPQKFSSPNHNQSTMKKLILTGAALIAFAAATQAQIFQNGIQQFAQQIQSGTGQTGVISQLKGDGTNYGNYAITFQGTSSNTGANQANITQNGGPNPDGTGGGPNSGSQGNRGAITQNGGPGNLANINQNGGPDGISGGGVSTSATISAPGQDGNFAGILQQGSNNTALINENNNSRRNAAEVYQNGNGLNGTILQSNGSVNNKASINQGFVNNNAGVPITNSVATINQGKINAGDASASAAIAESIGNTANITQSVSNVQAVISQGSSSIGGGNPGRAEGSTAGITQNAVNSFVAFIEQGVNSGESIGSRATITVTGENNTVGFVTQGSGPGGTDNGSTASISMAGTTSQAVIQQAFAGGQTDGDAATITQSSAVQNSIAFINQGNGAATFSRNDKATINQTGQNNLSGIVQNSVSAGAGQANGSDNIATVKQMNGVSTVQAFIEQGVSSNGETAQAVRNQATITQSSGTGLQARIGQGSLNQGSAILTTQNGTNTGTTAAMLGSIANDNMATITQSGGNNQIATVLQSGRNNLGTITQSAGSNNSAQIVQTGNSRFGRAVITQSSSGNGNDARAFQFAGTNADGRGAYGNEIEISQVGTGSNNVAIAQQGFQGATSSSNDNFIRFTQNGSNNQARMLQTGNNNFVDVTQNGNDNVLQGTAGPGTFASQQGYNNRLTLVQNSGSGAGKVFTYTQIGNNNTQNVVQSNP